MHFCFSAPGDVQPRRNLRTNVKPAYLKNPISKNGDQKSERERFGLRLFTTLDSNSDDLYITSPAYYTNDTYDNNLEESWLITADEGKVSGCLTSQSVVWRHKSPATWLLKNLNITDCSKTSTLLTAQKLQHYWHFVRGITCDRWISHKGPVMRKIFPCREVFHGRNIAPVGAHVDLNNYRIEWTFVIQHAIAVSGSIADLTRWMKMYTFRLRFHWSMLLEVQSTIFQHWLR